MNYGDVVTYRSGKDFNVKEKSFNKSNFFNLLSSVFVFLMLLSAVSALTQTYSKNGDAFSSASGEYATSTHCLVNNTCTWISGSQVILGVYNGAFNGGSATWTFNVTQPLSQITSAEVKISWPRVYGKGLHSIGTSTTSNVKVGSTTIASPVTSTAIACGTGDQYAYACFDAVPTYTVPVSAISSSTNVTISVPSNTLWDVGTVQLVINYSEPVACSSNNECGANDWVSGTNTCSNNDVYQNFKTFTCNNAGTSSAYCSNSTALTFKTDCGDTTYGSWSANYCNASGNVEKIRDVYNKGCASGACTQSTTQETQTVQACTNGCTNGTCNGAAVTCSTNTDCGIDGTIGMYPYYCSNNDQYAMYRTYTCSNPGTSSSSCSYNDGPKFLQDCGETHTGPWETTCNIGIFIQRTQITYNQGCVQEGATAYCQYYEDNNTLPLIYCEKGCSNGACLNSACWLDSQCGTSGWVAGTTQCYLNDVYQNYTTASCSNPGYSYASCSNKTELKLKEACANGCSNGACSSTASGIKIVNGKIKIDGTEFLIKGLDYAPWLDETGPSSKNWQDAFPQNRLEDVTLKVTSNGKVNVKDYSGDGKIQAWEVIRFDVETMKKIGANTIRTYATAHWHDKDLDGVLDSPTANVDLDELKQGDLPDWAVAEILTWANANNMKVIMGYWVEEENFKETPFVANWDDLLVAKQALGFMMNKYKSNPAVLAWGIGNEVNGTFNQGWFSWGVNVNDYLNALFAHARTIDTTHPIIYAKYVGENANFNNLTADIISVNAFIFDIPEILNRGEFSISAPQGKAYMFGEFGHLIEQADQHWVESQKYAGGAFLEYNSVWWKGDGHNTFGIVDEFRAINSGRYNELNRLFGGAPVCSTNAECGTNTIGSNTCDGKNVVRTNTIYTCNNPGTQSSSCSTSQQTELVETCSNTCSNGACVGVCSTNSQCGLDDWIIGTNNCSNNDVYQDFKVYTCNNPGTSNSSCSNSTVFKLKQDCGDTTTGAWSANYCNGKNVEKSRTTYLKGCETGACTSSTTTETQLVQTCANNCLNGSCTAVCSTSSQCGVNGYLNTPTCSGNYVKDTYRTYKCNNAGTSSSYCSYTDVLKTKQTCSSSQICSNGSCTVPNCKYDSQCNDNIALTLDKCENPNTINSVCTHTPIACTTTSHCGVTGWLGQTTCNGNNVGDYYRTYKCNNPGTINAYCSSTDVLKTRKTCYTGTLCYEGSCIKPACTSNASCGTSGAGVKICEGNNVVQTYNQYTCNNPSTPQAVCSNQQTTTFVESCVNGCSSGKCLPPPCGFSDGIIVSAESKPFTAWDISKVQLTISYKSGSYTKTATLSKNGNEIYSGEGSYATSSSCGGICNWVSGDQVIVGAIDSNPSNWGGKVSWKFDLGTIDPTKITQIVTKVYRPSIYGKGLHSPFNTGSGVLKLEEMTLANLSTSKAKCGTDWFAHSCSTTYLSYTKAINSTTCNLP